MQNHIMVTRRSVQVLRILTSLIFLVAGGNHLLNTQKTVGRLEQASFKGIAFFFGEPMLLVILSGVVMLAAGSWLLIGYKPRWTALTLIGVLIPITLTVQVGQITTLGPLFKNIAILGSLFFFLFNDTTNSIKP